MSTVSDTIIAAIQAALAGIAPAPASVELEPAGDPPGGTCLEIYDPGDSVIERECSIVRWSKQITITGFVDADTATAPSADRNALHAAVVRALMADETLGGTAEQIDPGDRRNQTAVLGSIRRLAFDQDFTVTFTTRRSDPAYPF